MSSEEKAYFAARLRTARRCAGFKSARQFLKTHDIAHSTYMQYESGTRLPTDETIKNYADILKVNFDWLKSGTGDPLSETLDESYDLVQREQTLGKELKKNLIDLVSEQPNTLNETLMAYLIAELITLYQQHNKPIDGRALAKAACKMYADVIAQTKAPEQYLPMARVAVATYQHFAF